MTALRYAVNTYGKSANTHFHVCNVQPKLHRHIGKYFSSSAIRDWQQERANKELKFALQYLEKSGVLFSSNVVSGEKGDAIYDEAVNQGCNRIIIGSAKKNIWNRLFENSITTVLLEKSNIPVEVITGRSLTPLERWGVPAIGAGATIALMSAVID